MQPRHVRKLRYRRSDRPVAANALVKAPRQVFSAGIDNDLVVANSAREVPYLHTTSQGFHAWTPEEIAASVRHSRAQRIQTHQCHV
jgi:hypothetical protein